MVLVVVVVVVAVEVELGAMVDEAFEALTPTVEAAEAVAEATLIVGCMDETKEEMGLAEMLMRGVAVGGNVHI